MKSHAIAIAFLFCTSCIQAQTYNFTQAQNTYADINNATTLTTSAPWTYATSFTVPIGFALNYMGSNFTTIYVEGSGFAYFDFNYYNLTLPFTVKLQSKGNSGNNSPISYSLTGAAPNRICKIQWKNAGFYYDTTSTINFQLWLHETSNIIEVHIGSSNVPNPSVVYQENGSDGPVIGLFKYNSPSNCTYSNCLSGNPSAAVSNTVTGNINLFAVSLTGTPPINTVYIFDPNSNNVMERTLPELSLYPNPAAEFLTIESGQQLDKCTIYSSTGNMIEEQQVQNNVLHVGNLTQGIYFLETRSNGILTRTRFVVVR